MWTAWTCPGHFSAQAKSKAVESAPPLNATASGNTGEKVEIASANVVVTRYLPTRDLATRYLDAALVSVNRP